MHEGTGKIWYAIPDYHREKFERLTKDKLASRFRQDPNLLLDINIMVDPAYLVENGVHVYRTLQRPGEIILTFPGSYHQGVSVGFNIAEAVNIAIPSWLKHIPTVMKKYMATKEKIPVFPVEWMLIENIRKIKECKFDVEIVQKLKYQYQIFLLKEITERSLIASNFPDKSKYESQNLFIL